VSGKKSKQFQKTNVLFIPTVSFVASSSRLINPYSDVNVVTYQRCEPSTSQGITTMKTTKHFVKIKVSIENRNRINFLAGNDMLYNDVITQLLDTWDDRHRPLTALIKNENLHNAAIRREHDKLRKKLET